MEFKKCSRCGNFFISNNDICCDCAQKDRNDIAKLNSILNNSSNIGSVYDLSITSGIKVDNINRFIDNKFISL